MSANNVIVDNICKEIDLANEASNASKSEPLVVSEVNMPNVAEKAKKGVKNSNNQEKKKAQNAAKINALNKMYVLMDENGIKIEEFENFAKKMKIDNNIEQCLSESDKVLINDVKNILISNYGNDSKNLFIKTIFSNCTDMQFVAKFKLLVNDETRKYIDASFDAKYNECMKRIESGIENKVDEDASKSYVKKAKDSAHLEQKSLNMIEIHRITNSDRYTIKINGYLVPIKIDDITTYMIQVDDLNSREFNGICDLKYIMNNKVKNLTNYICDTPIENGEIYPLCFVNKPDAQQTFHVGMRGTLFRCSDTLMSPLITCKTEYSESQKIERIQEHLHNYKYGRANITNCAINWNFMMLYMNSKMSEFYYIFDRIAGHSGHIIRCSSASLNFDMDRGSDYERQDNRHENDEYSEESDNFDRRRKPIRKHNNGQNNRY